MPTQAAFTYEILIEGLELYGYHGVFSAENTLGQRFLLDLTLRVDLPEDLCVDDPSQVLSYAIVTTRVKEWFLERPYKLLETVAAKILQNLREFPQIQTASLVLKKLHPPIPETMKSVGVRLSYTYH